MTSPSEGWALLIIRAVLGLATMVLFLVALSVLVERYL